MKNKDMVVFAIIDDVPWKEGFVIVYDKNKPSPAMGKNPGGKAVENETPDEALARELREEISCEVEVYKDQKPFIKDLGSHLIVIVRARYVSG